MSRKLRENELGTKFYGVQKGSKPVHRYFTSQLIAGKVEIDSFFCLIGDICFFRHMFIEKSSIFYVYVAQNLIGCRVDMKGKFLKKKY